MHRRLQLAIISPCLLIVLVAAAVFPLTALADEAAPPPPDTAEAGSTEVAPPSDGTDSGSSEAVVDLTNPTAPDLAAEVATEVAPDPTSNEVLPTDVLTEAVPEDAALTDAPPSDETTELAPVEAVTTQVAPTDLPPDTDLVVLDSGGAPLPLATNEAAIILATGDPVWCPDGHRPGAADCTYTEYDESTNTFVGYSDLGELVDYLAISQPGEAGTIWIEAGTDGSSAAISMDAYNGLDTMEHYALTLQGGWDGNFDQAGTLSGTTTFSNSLYIGGWQADLTLNDLIFQDTTQYGLNLDTTGDINLTDVTATLNENGGAYLENCVWAGAGCTGTGDVNITDSHFDLNQPHDVPVPPDLPPVNSTGLTVYSGGDITLTGTSASENQGQGARLLTYTEAGDVSITDSEFNSNFLDGLNIYPGGDISLSGVVANDNGQFSEYQEGSQGTGAVLDNCNAVIAYGPCFYWDGSIYVEDSEFNGNYQDGLVAISKNAISLVGTSANDNGNDLASGHGAAWLWNANEGSSGAITVQDGSFTGNYLSGLTIASLGDITLHGLLANNNGLAEDPYSGDGAVLETYWYHSTGTISVSESTFNDNYAGGLEAISFGDITLNQVDATGNGQTGLEESDLAAGADLDNCLWNFSTELCDGGGDVLIAASTFGSNFGSGLNVWSFGDISLDAVSANDNGAGWDEVGWLGGAPGQGAILDNATDGADGPALGDITVTGPSSFSGNYLDGLDIYTNGNIAISGTTASDNGLSGEYGIGGLGIGAMTGGESSTVKLTDVVVNDNLDDGAMVGSWDGAGDVILTDVTAIGNGDEGIAAYTDGNIIVDPSTFASNAFVGLDVGAGGDVLVDCNYFADNGEYGLVGYAGGTFTLSGNTFAGNGYDVEAENGVIVLDGCRGGSGGGAGGAGGASGPPAITAPPYHTVNVAGVEGVGLDCAAYAGTILMLPNGDHAVLPCPLTGQATLKPHAQDTLPRALVGGSSFVSAMEVSLTQDGQPATAINGTLGLHFIIPPDQAGKSMDVLHWDNGAWEQLGGIVSADGYFESTHNETGVFVLVSG